MVYAAVTLVICLVPLTAGLIAWRWMVWMPGKSYRGPLSLTKEEFARQESLRQQLTILAEQIGERHLRGRSAQLRAAAEFIEDSLQAAGLSPHREAFEVDGQTVWNITAECRGSSVPGELILIGAHYDTIPGTPGADDNGSAVVVNLALAEIFTRLEVDRTLRFAFFVNEEAPYHMTAAMGSLRHAEACRLRQEKIVGMISLEMLGCFHDDPWSQRYPLAILTRLYPSRGNFVAVVGNLASRRWLHRVVRGLRRSHLAVEGMAAPRWLKDIFRSDHAAFWHCDYPAVMITDTANFRNAHYHSAGDTVDHINFRVMTRVVTALAAALQEVAACELAPRRRPRSRNQRIDV
jgi:hypothetical protein